MVRLGKRQVELATRWIPSATLYGATAALAGLYFTDWKLVLQYMPIYNAKFAEKK